MQNITKILNTNWDNSSYRKIESDVHKTARLNYYIMLNNKIVNINIKPRPIKYSISDGSNGKSPHLIMLEFGKFLLVINSNLPLILHRFQVMADYLIIMADYSSKNFGCKREYLTLSLSLGVIPCPYRHK